MTTITKLEPKTYQGKVTGHTVTFSDGVSGYLDDKKSDKGLVVGQEVTYTTEVKQNKSGGNYNLLTIKGNSGTPVPQQSYQRPPSTPQIPAPATDINKIKTDAAIQAMRYTMDSYIEGKTAWVKVKEEHRELCQYLWDAIDEVFKG